MEEESAITVREILRLYESDVSMLSERLQPLSSKYLCDLWKCCIQEKPTETTRTLNALFKGLSGVDSVVPSECRYALYVCAVQQLQMGELSASLTTEILGLLLLETSLLSVEELVKLLLTFIETVQRGQYSPGKWLEIFPHALSCVSTRDRVPHNGEIVTGQDFRSHIITSLCSSKWPHNYIVSLAATFKDLSLNLSELKFVFDKLLHLLEELEYSNVPPLVYQLLHLSIKGHRQMVLQKLINFFNTEDKKASRNVPLESAESESLFDDSCQWDELRRCEGTVLLHFLFAVKYDQDLGQELVKFLKLHGLLLEKVLMPFTLSLSFCLASDVHFQEQIFAGLESIFKNCYKTQLNKCASAWVRTVADSEPNPEDVMAATIRNSVTGWDYVIQGLVEFGFALMETYGGNKTSPLKGGKDASLVKRKMCDLGYSILLGLFKENRSIQTTILKKILSHVLPTESQSMSQYIELLSKSIQVSPQVYTEELQKVREVLDYLAWLPSSSAAGLLKALQPLLKISPTLRDATLLVLRKAMFSRHIQARKISVCGFFLCLSSFRVMGSLCASQSFNGSSSSSQFSADVHVHMNSNTNEALCLEVLGMLRRSLSQQADVRMTVYQGLPKIINTSPHLTNAVLDLLLNQANVYIEAGAVPPLRIRQCLQMQGSEPCLLEPLPHLVKCIHKCIEIAVSQNNVNEEGQQWTHPLVSLLEDLVKAMIKVELDDYDLDKSADYGMTTAGNTNCLLAVQVMGVCETLIEYSFQTNGCSVSMARDVLALFDNYQELVTLEKGKRAGQAEGAKKKKNNGHEQLTKSKKENCGVSGRRFNPESLLSENFVSTFLKSLLMDKMPSNQEALSLLRKSAEVEFHFVNIAVQKVLKVSAMLSSRKEFDSPAVLTDTEGFEFCCCIGRILLHRYSSGIDESQRNASVSLKALEGFLIAISTISELDDAVKFDSFIRQLVRDNSTRLPSQKDGDKQSESIIKLIKSLQRLVDRALDAGDNTTNCKEVVMLLQVLDVLLGKLSPDSELFNNCLKWMENLFQRDAVDDSTVICGMLSVVFKLKRQHASHLIFLKELTRDAHMHLGDVDEDVAVQKKKLFRLISKSTVPKVVSSTMEELENCLTKVNLILDILKAKLTAGQSDKSGTKQQAKERSICIILESISSIMLEVLQSAVPSGPCVETILRFTTKYYAILGEITKYFTNRLNIKSETLCPRLEKLVKIINSLVTQKVYPFIMYVQQSSESQAKAKQGKDFQHHVTQSNKEARLIPPLIYSIEQYEMHLIKLSKKSKVNLTSKMKMSTNRDFRIVQENVKRALEEQQVANEDLDETVNEVLRDADRREEPSDVGDAATEHSTCDNDSDDSEGNSLAPPSKKPKESILQLAKRKKRMLGTKSPKVM